ncbi:MAG TPA: prepilin-type N-terminal cleavage/methylation domain-containing protein [bacterium]|nr:prepilin-type N-terminal cleavage/methylation domain-containing protein [bacterium]HQO36683.1 prepilin-type N-terminal cleavage/methylation domain-containing protein [bacterium]HQP98892.1 prepilin-type N-terminal cleavage/methylation domain-containing protein [bacterium]
MKRLDAFTLVELLVVVAIIGILAAIVTPNVITQIDRAKFSKTQALISSLEVALETYKVDYKQYPPGMYNVPAAKAVSPAVFYKIIGERAKSPVSIQGKDLAVFESGQPFWASPSDPGTAGPVASILSQGGVPSFVLAASTDASGDKPKAIVDAWGSPLYYVSSQVYCPNGNCLEQQMAQRFADMPIAYDQGGTSGNTRGTPKNPRSFQIISFGPDRSTNQASFPGGIGSNNWEDKVDNDGDDLIDRGDNANTTANNTPAEDDVTNF